MGTLGLVLAFAILPPAYPNYCRQKEEAGTVFQKLGGAAQLSKLAELRAKTDRELVSIIDNALEVGLLLAANEPDVDPVGVLHRRAADIYTDTVMLVEKVENVGERRRLEARLRQLRHALDRRVRVQMSSA